MAAYLTWRGIPPPRSLRPLVQRAQQPHVPPPQPGTYGNAAVAGMTARDTRLDGRSYSSWRTMTTLPPRSCATTATRAMNARARTSAATSSTSPSPSTSAPPAPVATPHQQRATDATQATGNPAPSRPGKPQSPRQERASKRAAQRQPTQHHTATGIWGHRASPTGSRAIPSPTNTGAVGTQPNQPPGTAYAHRKPAPSPTGSPQPLKPPVASAHGPRPAASQTAATQAHAESRPHHGTPDRPAAGPAYAPPDGPPTQAHSATPTDTTASRPSDTVHPRTPGPTEGLIAQAPATSGAEDLPATTHDRPAPHQPGRRRSRQSRHLPVAEPPARARAWTRGAPPPRRALGSPPARKADPSRCPWRKATPEGSRNQRTMKTNRLHCQPNRIAGSPRWAQRKCGGRRNGHQRQRPWGSLAGEGTRRQCRVPTNHT